MLIWRKQPVYVAAKWQQVDAITGKTSTKKSLLLASWGYWGAARHLDYLFELMAAYSWCLLANSARNRALPMLYCSFLTVLLLHRAKRDEEKCLAKYGKDFKQHMQLVPWRMLPNAY
jgi:7-dehydrocholesterol reductase